VPTTSVWVWRAVYIAVGDRQPIQIHVSWLTGLPDAAEDALRYADPRHRMDPRRCRRSLAAQSPTVLQHTPRASREPVRVGGLGIPDATIVFVAHATTLPTAQRRPIEHSRYTWPTDAVRISDYYSYAPGMVSTGRSRGGRPAACTRQRGPLSLLAVLVEPGSACITGLERTSQRSPRCRGVGRSLIAASGIERLATFRDLTGLVLGLANNGH